MAGFKTEQRPRIAFCASVRRVLRYSPRAFKMTLSSLSSRIFAVVALAVLVLAPAGCARRIGDGCTLDTDCSINNDRRCDLSQQGGYCTIAECDRNSCPDDALCMEFFADVARRTRRFCVAPCNVDGDCRSGYKCMSPDVQGLFGTCPANASAAGCTRLLDDRTGPGTSKPRTKFCALPSPQ